ncbi:MAG: hypothetical protein LBS12_01500 [Prevotellaceae bacterium]|jgi:hypothetical protein|nr:hypothetical protein [Prevotellaceae bacterium]
MNAQELTNLLASPENFGKIIKGKSAVSLFALFLLPAALLLVLLGLRFPALIYVGIVLAVIGFACFLAGKLFLDAKATKVSLDLYYAAGEHRVCPQVSVKDYVYEDKDGDKSKYAILAFQTDGKDIPPQTVAELRDRVAGIDISTVRYESAGYPKLELIRGKGEAFVAENNSIFALASDMEGVYIYPLAYDKANDNSPFVVYASTGNDVYIYPLMERELAKL